MGKLLEHQIAIVTGGANGIGRGIALGMAKEGADIVIADIDEINSQKTAEKIRELGRKVLVISTDVSSNEDNNKLVKATIAEFGKVDILVNNAGINTKGGIVDITKEGALSVFNTNLIGPFFLTQKVIKEMINKKIKGCILFTSSVHSHITQLHPAYVATKAALEMVVKDIALELASYGIRVNAVAPGAIAIKGEKDRTNPHVPLGYSGLPEDVANAMIFLASGKSNYVTGQTLVVDGGFSLAHTWHWIQKGIL